MSLPKLPSPPRDPRNLSSKERSRDTDCSNENSRSSLHVDNQRLSGYKDSPSPRRPSFALKARKSFSALRSISGGKAQTASEASTSPAQADVEQSSPPVFNPDPFGATCLGGRQSNVRPTADAAYRSLGASAPDVSADQSNRVSSYNPPFDDSLDADETQQELASLGDRLEAVFDMHASRRMKPSKKRRDDLRPGLQNSGLMMDSLPGGRPLDSCFTASTPHLPQRRLSSVDQSQSRVVSPTHSVRTPRSFGPQAAERLSQSMISLDPGPRSGLASPASVSPARAPLLSFALASPPEDANAYSSRDSIDPTQRRPAARSRASSYRNSAASRSAAHLGLTPMGKSVENLGDMPRGSRNRLPSNPDISVSSPPRSPRSVDAQLGDAGVPSARASTLPSRRPHLTSRRSSQRIASFFRSSIATSELNLGQNVSSDDLRFSQDNSSSSSPRKVLSTKSRPKRLGVSIPSQRRWVGYWARMLAKADARATLDYMTPSKPQRLIRIVRVSVLQSSNAQTQAKDSKLSTAKKSAKALAKMDSFSVSVGRYDDGLVDQLEGWERGARRRARAYGVCNPSARAPVLTFSKSPENLHQAPSCVPGEEAWKTRSRRPSSRDWKQCADYNTAEAARKRLAQHDNDEGVGEWGVDVAAEAERVRYFNWPDGHVYDEEPTSKDFKFLNWFTKLEEQQKAFMDADEYGEHGGEELQRSNKCGVWHHFGTRSEAAVTRQPATKEGSKNSLRGGQAQNTLPRNSGDTSTRGQAEANGYTLPDSGGLLISPDREVCIRIHMANKAFKILPDIAGAAGWAWFIPAFEDPLQAQSSGHKTQRPQPGVRTVVRFERDEIDFAKKVTGLEVLEVEWEWVDTGYEYDSETDADAEEETESVSEGDDELVRQARVGHYPYHDAGLRSRTAGSREDSDGPTPSEASLRTVSSRNTHMGETASFTTVPALSTPVLESMMPPTFKSFPQEAPQISIGDGSSASCSAREYINEVKGDAVSRRVS